MTLVDEAIGLAQECTKTGWKSLRLQQLIGVAQTLDATGLEELRIAMSQEQDGLSSRMARRACSTAPCSTANASRIVDAMEILFGLSVTLEALREADYESRLIACARRFILREKSEHLLAADNLIKHVRETFGDKPEYRELLDQIQRRIVPEQREGDSMPPGVHPGVLAEPALVSAMPCR